MSPLLPMLKHPPYGPGQPPLVGSAASTATLSRIVQLAHAHDIYGQGIYAPDYHPESFSRKKKKTGGRKHGSQGYTKQDVKQLLDLIDALKPVDREGWEQINLGYNRYAHSNERQDREPENLKKKFMSLVNYKSTNDQDIPDDVRRAKKIHHLIEPQSIIVEEEDFRFRKRKLPDGTGIIDFRGWMPNGALNKDQLKLMISQLATQHQHTQAQQQQAHQHLAQQLSLQFLQHQQQHKVAMMGMTSSLLQNTRQLPGARDLNLPTSTAADWSVATVAAINAAAATLKHLSIESWANTINAECLSAAQRESILEISRERGWSSVRDLMDALESPMRELTLIFDGFNPVEIARLKKALSQLVVQPLKEENVDPSATAPLAPAPSQLGAFMGPGVQGLRPLPTGPPTSHSLYNALALAPGFNSPPSHLIPFHQMPPPSALAPQPFHANPLAHPPAHLLNPHQLQLTYGHPLPSQDHTANHVFSLDSFLSQSFLQSPQQSHMIPPPSPQHIPSLPANPQALAPS